MTMKKNNKNPTFQQNTLIKENREDKTCDKTKKMSYSVPYFHNTFTHFILCQLSFEKNII